MDYEFIGFSGYGPLSGRGMVIRARACRACESVGSGCILFELMLILTVDMVNGM